MIQSVVLSHGVTLRYCRDKRFKTCGLGVRFLRPMCWEEASKNTLIPAVLLRGTRSYPDMRSISSYLEDMYGMSVRPLLRRVGDAHVVGFNMSLLEDRFALNSEPVFASAVAFLQELLLEPLLEDGVFVAEFVDSEKKNLIDALKAEINAKASYAGKQMIRKMCQGDSYAVSYNGRIEDVEPLTPEELYAHYRKLITESPVELVYMGSESLERISELLMPLARALGTLAGAAPVQKGFVPQTAPGDYVEEMDISQAKLAMGFVANVDCRHPDYIPMMVLNVIFGGGGMNSKLFAHVREEQSLCYSVSSQYMSDKGIVLVGVGIDEEKYEQARAEILHQLDCCVRGEITSEELEMAKLELVNNYRVVPDSPGAMVNFFFTALLLGMETDLSKRIAAVKAVTVEDVARCAAKLQLHTTYFLKGGSK